MKAGLTPELWHTLSPYLDQLLDLEPAARQAWLDELQLKNPGLAEQLAVLLEEHYLLCEEGFLEAGPEFPEPLAAAGETLGTYRLIEPIGIGGMGTVWLAARGDGRFERQVAVKFPNISLRGHAEERFRREGTIVGRLAHPHIAQLIDAGLTDTGRPYLVLEYVKGVPIDEYCNAHLLGVEARLRLFLDVLAAVAHAHANLVVHRDLKPSNVLVTANGDVKLLDFGVAKLLEEEFAAAQATALTREAGVALTPEFAAPEQFTGGFVTTATDIYALGVLLYSLLTGRHPAGTACSSPADLVRAVVERDATRPSEWARPQPSEPEAARQKAAERATTPERLQRRLRGDLDTVVLKALKKDPAERYASAHAFADDLRKYLSHEPIAARPDSLPYRTTRFVRRNRVPVALGVLASVAVLAGVSATLMQARTASAEREFALRQLARAEAVNELNQFVLSDAAPSGQPFTVTELLARAEEIVARQGGGELHRVELMIAIGRQYWSHDLNDRARTVLLEARTRAQGLADPSTSARAACALASVLARGEDLDEAERLYQEGVAALPDGPQFALDRMFCLQCGSEVARDRGVSRDAVARAEEAQRAQRDSPFRTDLQELGLLMELAESYRVAGDLHLASATFRQAATRLSELGRDNTEKAGTLFNNWGVALSFLGQPLEAEQVLRRAIAISSDDRGEEAVSPMLLVNYSRALRHLGRPAEAIDYAARAYEKGQQVEHQVVMNQALLELARDYLDQHDFGQAERMLDEVEPKLRAALPPHHLAFAGLALERSRVIQGHGDLPTALAVADRAALMLEANVPAGSAFLPPFLLRRAELRQELGHLEEAAEDIERALRIWGDTMPPDTTSSNLGRAWLAFGLLRRTQARFAEARVAFQTALSHFESAAGPAHPDSERCRTAIAELVGAYGG
jgi:eukaryotic-like serine/threonine-protein kinase